MTDVVLTDPKLPAFTDIKPENIQSELQSILQRNRETIAALVCEPVVNWATLAQPMDNLSDQLNKYWSPISHLNSVLNSKALREAYNAALPELSSYATDIGQNRALCEAYNKLKCSVDFANLSTAQRKSVDNTLRDFHLAGVDLPDDKKARYKDISQQLAKLCSKFNDNLLDATQAWSRHLTEATSLAGLPATALANARQAASRRGLEGWVITLDFPSYHAVMTYAQDRALRQELYEAYQTRASDQGPHAGRYDNARIMQEILQLRLEQSKLLGFDNFADYSLATKMAGSATEVLQFLNDLAAKSVARAHEEFSQLQQFANEQGLAKLEVWDVSYYADKLKQARFAISEEDLKPYFPADKVINGMFAVVERLFGITLEERTGFNAYHDDLRYFAVQQEGKNIAGIYMDLYARENKRGGAWMADYSVRRKLDNEKTQKPVAFITCNFAPATTNQPALLTHNEVTTLFHEFGHALHHMLTKIDCFDVSGINGVPWDAVELPSQFLENWCWEEQALTLISGHYQTGEPLPQEMLDKMLAAKNFQSAMAMVRQLEFALFDFYLHLEFNGQENYSVQALLNRVRDQVAVMQPPAFNRFQHSFSHIFAGGYAAGYYSYKWAEILAADAFSKFTENGIFDRNTGQQFLRAILEKGGSCEPIDLFIEFRGRPPQTDALLRQCGITDHHD